MACAQGKDPATKSDEILEKFQTAFDPPPSLSETYISISLNLKQKIKCFSQCDAVNPLANPRNVQPT